MPLHGGWAPFLTITEEAVCEQLVAFLVKYVPVIRTLFCTDSAPQRRLILGVKLAALRGDFFIRHRKLSPVTVLRTGAAVLVVF